jgi:hypothetical protein
MLKFFLENYVFNESTCTLLALSLKHVVFSWIFCQHKLLSFVGQCLFFKFLWFSFTKCKVSIYFWVTFVKPMQGNGVVYLTVLAPYEMSLWSNPTNTTHCQTRSKSSLITYLSKFGHFLKIGTFWLLQLYGRIR